MYLIVNVVARENRRGLVVQLVNGCVHYKSCQERLIQSIYKAFGIQDNDPGAMATVSLCVLSMYSHNRLKEEGFIAKPNIQGSLMLSSLLKFDSKYSNAFANSLLSLGLETLQSFASDPIRSRILDAFIQSDTIQNKKKRELIYLFKGMYVVLAVDKYGSRFFEKLWDQANLEMKDEILAELIKSKMKLQQSFVGKYIVRNTALELFEKRKDEWLNYQKGLNKARKKDKKGDEIDQLFLAKGK
jgi:nucleolar protein 9